MEKKITLVLASRNKGKTAEIKELLKEYPVNAVPTGPALTYEGRCEGVLTEEPTGKNGFGYDPYFYYPKLNKTFAQLSREEKSSVSHRGKALKGLIDEFDKVTIWINQNMPKIEKFECA